MSDDRYKASSNVTFFPGLDSSEVDHLLLRPKTSWRGVRGAAPSFQMPWDGLEEDMFLDDELEDELDDEFDDEMFEEDLVDEFGKLYRYDGDYRLAPSTSADPGVVLGRSGWSGYRGARDSFRTGLVGPEASPKGEYEYVVPDTYGSPVEAQLGGMTFRYHGPGEFAVAAGALALLWRLSQKR